MNGCCENQEPMDEIYQLRIRIKDVSPMIWRRMLVRSDSSIADLHLCIQIAFGWSDTYLNQVEIYGKPYGVYHDGGIDFGENPRQVYLKDFQFGINDKFIYEYNFFDHWEHEIRFEKRLHVDSKKTYPCCIGGARAAPIEDCGGPNAFMALEEHYSPWQIQEKVIKSVRHYQKGIIDLADIQDIFRTLGYWVNRHRFNRRAVNDRLRRYANGDDVDDLIWEGSCDEH